MCVKKQGRMMIRPYTIAGRTVCPRPAKRPESLAFFCVSVPLWLKVFAFLRALCAFRVESGSFLGSGLEPESGGVISGPDSAKSL
jgi:hypothetical protein